MLSLARAPLNHPKPEPAAELERRPSPSTIHGLAAAATALHPSASLLAASLHGATHIGGSVGCAVSNARSKSPILARDRPMSSTMESAKRTSVRFDQSPATCARTKGKAAA